MGSGIWSQDTDEVSTFFGVLNVSLRACGAQLGFNQPGTINDNENPPRNLEKPWKPTKTMTNHEATLKNHGNQPKTMKNHETTLKNHGNQSKTMQNHETTLKNHGNQPKTMARGYK